MKDYQHMLFPYAYNILGTAEDAKDAIQDVLYKFLAGSKEEIEDPKNYLIRSVINQSINIRDKRKKMQLGDMWLPEPVDTEGADTNINLNEIVSYSLLILLEKLNAKERAVFILKEAFAYSHEEIGQTLSVSVEHSRKLLSRAKQKIDQVHAPVAAPRNEGITPAVLEKFMHAIRGRDVKALEHLLTEDIAYYADGGNVVKVFAKNCTGYQEVAELLVFVFHKYSADFRVEAGEINHQPALLFYNGEELKACQVFGIEPESNRIFQISNVLDPRKLQSLGGGVE
ncbi:MULTISPECIES: sigma-70 family RNA polymerase sigma factor [Niastella]|uniref:Sigma-70 family RNA polymerase sigma factor n=1 Tax=Niastella soli TaxID=2821487 RepID=A0ABS3YRV6_9BACT|nr:sigma-70 family RNA polymerase sigma factor [Niastella soli]MBO9200632.1 sigma-70 family RNA polymerase sigma factor [Niastella soli]